MSLVGAGGKTTLMFHLAAELARRGETVLTTTTTRILAPEREESPILILARTPEEVLERAKRAITRHRHLTAGCGPLLPGRKVRGFAPEIVDALWLSGGFRWILVEADGAAGRPLKAPEAHEPVIPRSSGWVVGLVGLDAVGRPLEEARVFRMARVLELTGQKPGTPITPLSVARLLLHPHGILKGSPEGALRLAFLNKADLDGALELAREIVKWIRRGERPRPNRVIIGQLRPGPHVVEWHDLLPDP